MQSFFDILWQVYYANLIKLKAAARIAENRTIYKMVDGVTGEGNYFVYWGDCSRTSVIAGASAGGPFRKIRRHPVKKGYNLCLVNERSTS